MEQASGVCLLSQGPVSLISILLVRRMMCDENFLGMFLNRAWRPSSTLDTFLCLSKALSTSALAKLFGDGLVGSSLML